jgi:L-seryl-tRNA(Ser) seleniumtransferase
MGILEELGVKRVINAAGTLTLLGGSVLSEEVVDAMAEMSRVYVDMEELHEKAGELVAKLLEAEAAYITDGAAAGLVLCAASCITKGDFEKALKLPETSGMANKILVQKPHRNMYDYVVSLAGAKLVEVGSNEGVSRYELEKAIDEQTAAVLYVVYDPLPHALSLEQTLELAHKHDVPVIVDAAAELPPVENLKKFVKMGADMVVFSGGKDIGAPNDTGVILGKRKWVQICRELGPQSYKKVSEETKVFIGRPMKVSKEDIAGFIAALKRYLTLDHEKRLKGWHIKARFIESELCNVKGVKARVLLEQGLGHPRPVCVPKVELEFDTQAIEVVRERLLQGDPPIYTYTLNGKLYINPQCLEEGEETEVVLRLKEVLASLKNA